MSSRELEQSVEKGEMRHLWVRTSARVDGQNWHKVLNLRKVTTPSTPVRYVSARHKERCNEVLLQRARGDYFLTRTQGLNDGDEMERRSRV